MREALVHCPCVEIPHWSPAHHIQAPRASKSKIDRGIHLLHKSGLLSSGIQPVVPCHGPEEFLHDEFAGERKHNCVKGNERKIPSSLCILYRQVRRRACFPWRFVREEYEFMDRICRSRIDGIEEEKDGKEGKRGDPSMLYCIPLPLLKNVSSFPSFRERLLSVSFTLRLLGVSICRVLVEGGSGLTLSVPGDGGLMSQVASAGTPVSPALISPPSPLDFLRRTVRMLSLVLGPERLVNVSPFGDAKGGNASVGMVESLEQIGTQ